jgi:hypothetical protein
MAVKNTQLDSHPKQGDEYLVHVTTSAIGDYHASSFDPQAAYKIRAKVTGDGNYSVAMYDANGTFSHTIHNGHKHSADSMSSQVTNHKYTGVGGGHAENYGTGHFRQTVATSSKATDGPHIHASKTTPMVLSPDGNGIHAVKGDQTHIVVQGGMYFAVDKGVSFNAQGSHGVSTQGDHITAACGSIGFASGGNTSLYANTSFVANVAGKASVFANTSVITFTIGASSIVMTNTAIVITAPSVIING